MMKWALISVSDKTGLRPFAESLTRSGWRFLSTGGTARALREWGLDVTPLSDWTGFPEILDGRVKTLHPRVHAALLADLSLPTHQETLRELDLSPLSLVVVNLYPFEQTLKSGASEAEMIEQIDIGGPTLIRAAAKNFRHVAAVCNPVDYEWVADKMNADQLDAQDRARLAARAFAHVAEYDAMIANWFRPMDPEGDFPETLSLTFRRAQTLRYGENPHQRAAFYRDPMSSEPSVATAQQLWGKEISYNNLLDADAALELIREFEQPACAIIKHTNPCGVAEADDLPTAYQHALTADPVSAFGGIIVCNRPINRATAEAITAPGGFYEVVIAPAFDDDALKLFQERKGWGRDVRLLDTGTLSAVPGGMAIRGVTGGLLYSDRDHAGLASMGWQVVTERAPTPQEEQDLAFAWKVVKHVKSNAIVFAKEQQLIGVGAGQMNRVGSVKLAVAQAGDRALGAVMASDAFFPFPDGVEEATAAGIRAVIQPGGSKKDPEVIEAANRLGLAMVFTGIRHFRH
ncbi:MAG: bifunctional phosphoribosylaminoimidazolecarboxamide formyltransferase/IMP cyclohydrolase [Fimbriimonadia bacterium]|nr:bifunctional phosphoribosylaminoimidazolecarboxamide formyltransferase/IMP cyclohydrolase [Fimbriimonadia bacterium]